MAANSNRRPSIERAPDDNLVTTSENIARVLGVLFIILGVGLIVFLIAGFIMSKIPYRVDPNLPIPTLDKTETHINKDSVDVTGTVLPGENVILYMNGDQINKTATTDEDGNFIFEDVTLTEEGTVAFESAVIRGGFFKRRSEYSNEVATVVDWTPPSSTIALDYEKDNISGKSSVKGKIDPNAVVVIEGNGETYEAQSNDRGEFTLEGVNLKEGSNSFSIRIKDKAGNEVVASQKIVIAYAPGDINGNGAVVGPVTNGKLPESAGELDAAMQFIAGNKLMFGIAVMSMLLFGVSTIAAGNHLRKTQ